MSSTKKGQQGVHDLFRLKNVSLKSLAAAFKYQRSSQKHGMGDNWYEVFGWFFQPVSLVPLDLPLCCTLPFMCTSLKDRTIAQELHVLGGQVRGIFSFKAKRVLVDVLVSVPPIPL